MKKSVIRMFDKKYRVWPAGAVLCLSAALTACGAADGTWTGTAGIPDPAVQAESADTIAEVPEYDGVPYVEINDNKITLSFHVIVSYGVSISAVSDNLISNVKYKVEEFTGMTIEKINIFVEGVRVID